MYHPTLDQFRSMAKRGNLIPVYKSIVADLETPVSAFYKIRKTEHAFLLESVDGGENIARHSYLGSNPSILFQSKGNNVTIEFRHTGEKISLETDDPLGELDNLMSQLKPVMVDGLPRFHGGAVGYMSYDMIRFFEKLPTTTVDDLNLPDCFFMITDTMLVFDRVTNQIKVVANAQVNGDVDGAYENAIAQIDKQIAKLKSPFLRRNQRANLKYNGSNFRSNITKTGYEEIVGRAKKYIFNGDIIQVVPSQRFSTPIEVDSFEVYRALRMVNPSPYMYYFKLGKDLELIGASPEMMVRVENGIAETRPIAGTRPRGKTIAEDDALAEELINDPKERAEHIMLVDLGRNDLGRVCEYNSVKVSKMMRVERYSHVMHIASRVKGKLRQGINSFDLIRACFPAGTLSGAPKIRAMEIIDELEPTRRGCYGGAVGYFSFNGNADTAITIRTIVVKDGIAYTQAGGGIVADSVAETEFQETENKARATMKAIRMAERGFEQI